MITKFPKLKIVSEGTAGFAAGQWGSPSGGLEGKAPEKL